MTADHRDRTAPVEDVCSRSVMFVINGLGVGGAEMQLLALMEAMTARGHAVFLVTINDDVRLYQALPSQVKHYPLQAQGWGAAARALPAFYRLVRNAQPDVVHAHLFQANVLSRLAKLAAPDCRVVNTTHCNYGLAHRRYNPYIVYRWTRRWVDVHTAVSAPALEALRKWRSVRPEQSMLLFNAIEVDRYRQAEPGSGRDCVAGGGAFRWIAVGRLNPVKNYGLLLEAVNRLHNSGQRLTLDIAGEGGEMDHLQDLVTRNGLERVVRFLGLVDDLPDRLAEYDGYVISSDNEALPMALLEAMAAGLPVVGTQVGEIPSLLTGSQGGYVVPPGAPAEFAAAMEKVMRMESLDLGAMGARNRAYVASTFSMDRIVEAWERIYRGQDVDGR